MNRVLKSYIGIGIASGIAATFGTFAYIGVLIAWRGLPASFVLSNAVPCFAIVFLCAGYLSGGQQFRDRYKSIPLELGGVLFLVVSLSCMWLWYSSLLRGSGLLGMPEAVEHLISDPWLPLFWLMGSLPPFTVILVARNTTSPPAAVVWCAIGLSGLVGAIASAVFVGVAFDHQFLSMSSEGAVGVLAVVPVCAEGGLRLGEKLTQGLRLDRMPIDEETRGPGGETPSEQVDP